MKLVNLTPHVIHLPDRVVEPAGIVARCAEVTTPIGSIDGVEFIRRSYGEVTDLPDPEEGTIFIVSLLARAACLDRADLASPGDLVRDAEGKIIGAKNLIVN